MFWTKLSTDALRQKKAAITKDGEHLHRRTSRSSLGTRAAAQLAALTLRFMLAGWVRTTFRSPILRL